MNTTSFETNTTRDAVGGDLSQAAQHLAEQHLPAILDALREQFANSHQDLESWEHFRQRFEANYPALFVALHHLYASHPEFDNHLLRICQSALDGWLKRSHALRQLDEQRLHQDDWYLQNYNVWATGYVERFAGSFVQLTEKVGYLKDLGVTCLHLLPIFKCPKYRNDGGYAIISYREFNEKLGTQAEFNQLVQRLQDAGIRLMLDFVLNHTSNDHEWARRAMEGESEYQQFYCLARDKATVDALQKHLPRVFDKPQGNFTFNEVLQQYVWTTFYEYQWDLNYANPKVFQRMFDEMMGLVNTGVDVLRMDAVPYLWKQPGTSCVNQPETHWILKAYNRLLRIAAPTTLLVSEAVVHPQAVVEYVSQEECRISYNTNFNALLWDALATKKVRLLSHGLARRNTLPKNCAWLNYTRLHDDLEWTFADEDCQDLEMNAENHRRFLDLFFSGHFENSFAKGLPFRQQYKEGQQFICGTTASLSGLELAMDMGDYQAIDYAVKRVLMLQSVILTLGGIPMLYLGDEVAQLNDYSFLQVPTLEDDARWAHRPKRVWENETRFLRDLTSPQHRVFFGLKHLISIRKQYDVFSGNQLELFNLQNEHILCFIRHNERNPQAGAMVVLANFNDKEEPVNLPTELFGAYFGVVQDLIAGHAYELEENFTMEAYQFMWLYKKHSR